MKMWCRARQFGTTKFSPASMAEVNMSHKGPQALELQLQHVSPDLGITISQLSIFSEVFGAPLSFSFDRLLDVIFQRCSSFDISFFPRSAIQRVGQ